MNRKCKYCDCILSEVNCYPSDWKRGGYICKKCRTKNYRKHITAAKDAEYCKNKRLNLKKEVIEKYGGACVCCGQDIWQFLTIDHSNNDGYSHRKSIGRSGGAPFYSWLKQQKYPQDGYRLLCYNCNCALGYFGFCPHNCIDSNCSICGSILENNIFEFYRENNTSICKSCAVNIATIRKTASNNKIKYRSLMQRRKDSKSVWLKIKLQLIRGYGGKCICCGEDNFMFLTIDHINNDGNLERSNKKYSQYKFYKRLIVENFPQDYRLLCYNCNCSRGSYGKCYHELCSELHKNSISIDEYKHIMKEGL